jgi:hypothetical protein
MVPTPPAAPHREGGLSRTPLILGLAGAALVAAGVGTWMTVSSIGDTNAAASLRLAANHDGRSCYGRNTGTCADADDKAATAQREQTAALGCFVGAATLAASALLVRLAWPSAPSGAQLGASVGAGHAAFVASARF